MYDKLNQRIAEIKFAFQLHNQGIIAKLEDYGFTIEMANCFKTSVSHSKPIGPNYNEIEWNFQHCVECREKNTGYTFNGQFSRRKF